MLIQQPGRIGNLRLKNRVLMAPMGTNYSTTDGLSTERDRAYYAERARGGVAMIMTEAMVVTEHARPHKNSLCCYHDRFIPGLASIVDAIKAHDCLVFGQLNHRGGLLRRSVLNMEPVGPSPWRNPNTGDLVRPLEKAEITGIQKLFVTAARRLWRAGYDGVEIHAANGYLFQQFFSPRINKRNDEYGGTLENRMRLLLETIGRLKSELPDLCLVVRLSGSEFAEGGYSGEEIVALARAVEQAGVAAIDVSGGSNESPQLSRYCIQPPSFPPGCLAPVAKPIKEAVSIPVFVAGRMVTPQDAEAVLASGSADFVALGRALYCDAHWMRKAVGEIKAPIRECIACNVCFERLTLEKDVSCVQNPMVGTEFETLEHAEPQLFEPKVAAPLRVLVIGAGVAGVEAARIIAGRGHRVEIWERAAEPGGQMPLACASPDKEAVRPVWTYRMKILQDLQVPIRLGAEATLERIEAYAPDFIVVATGSAVRNPPVDVSRLASSIPVRHAWDVLATPALVRDGALVTIIGGGMVGIELADLLRTRNCRVNVIEMLDTVASGMARNNRMELIERLAPSMSLFRNCRILDVESDSLQIQVKDEPPRHLPIGEALIFATGPKPALEVLPVVEASGIPYERIGDCSTPGDFLAAIRDGWMVGLALDRRLSAGRKTSEPIHERRQG
jgi:dimethylglycine catabolism A